MKESNTCVGNVPITHPPRLILPDTKGQYMRESRVQGQCMKESNSLVISAINNYLHNQIWSNTKGEYMKESNTLAGNAPIKQVQRDILMNIKGQSMKEFNTLVYSAETINFTVKFGQTQKGST